MLETAWLSLVMQHVPSEIYVLDAESLHLLHANEAACRRLNCNAPELAALRFEAIFPEISEQIVRSSVQGLSASSPSEILLPAPNVDEGTVARLPRLRWFHSPAETGSVLVAIGDIPCAAPAELSPASPMDTVLSTMPVLIFRLVRSTNGTQSFHYLSAGCESLLGISPDELQKNGDRILSLLLPEDRSTYIASLRASACSLSTWSWEGRIGIDEWKGVKWISVRATPRALPNGRIQWEGIMCNITESKAEQLELISSRTQLSELSAHIETVKEQERARIAREIHDDMGGNLTAIKMALAMLVRRLPENDASLHEKAAYVDTLIDRTLESIHRIAGDLRPSILDFGLTASVAWQAREFERQTGIRCIFETDKEDVQLASNQATALFRIVQEALTNISKHANASEVIIRLVRTEEYIHLEVIDDGRGISTEDCSKPHSFGIRGMRERAHALGCIFHIEGEKDKGTRLVIMIPLES